jgi:hypothetical protein
VKNHEDLSPMDLKRRVSQFDVKSLAEIVPSVEEGSYLKGNIPERWQKAFDFSTSETF